MNILFSTTTASFTFILLIAAGVLAQKTGPAEVHTVPNVDLQRYSGKWYEIAKYPNRFQTQCVGNTTANYTLKPNGRIEVRNECLLKSGKIKSAVGEAKITDKVTNAKLKVRFAPSALAWLSLVWGDYWIIDLDKEYGWVAIGEPKREYFWILSRKPEMDDATYRDILRRAEAMGFNPAKVERSPQK